MPLPFAPDFDWNEHEQARADLVSLVGQVSLEWSDAVDAVRTAFRVLAGSDEAGAEAVFGAIRNDRLERKIVRRLTRARFSPEHGTTKIMLQGLASLDSCAEERNVVIHSGFQMVSIYDQGKKIRGPHPQVRDPTPVWPEDGNSVERLRKLAANIAAASEMVRRATARAESRQHRWARQLP